MRERIRSALCRWRSSMLAARWLLGARGPFRAFGIEHYAT
jgi:hypothetical protein